MKHTVIILLAMCMGLSGCNRNDLCYEHPHGSLHVLMDWSNVPEHLGKPEGVRIAFYHTITGKDNVTYRGADGGKVVVPDSEYDILVFNSDTEFIMFENMSEFDKAEAYLDIRTRPVYRNSPVSKTETKNGIYYKPETKANDRTQRELTIGQPDRFFATHSSREIASHNGAQSKDTIIARPESRVLFVTPSVKVKGMKNVKECRASLSGAARGLRLSTGKPSDGDTGTIIFNMKKHEDTYAETIRTFGLMSSPPDTPAEEAIQHFFTLEFLLIDNSVKVFEFDIGGQIDFGSIKPEMTIPLEIDPIEIPDVKPGDGDGGFDADIGDWGEQEDIPITGK